MGKRGAAAKTAKEASAKAKQALTQRQAAAAQAAEWSVGTNSKKAQRDAEAEAKRRERLSRKAERAALAEAETASILAAKAPLGKARKAQRGRAGYLKHNVPAFGTDGAQKKKKKKKKTASDERPSERTGKRIIASPSGSVRDPVEPNVNRLKQLQLEEGVHCASGLDSSLAAAMAVASPTRAADVDRNPERRMKAAFASYSEREMARIRAERPALRRGQMQQMIFKSWQRSGENPMNAAAAAAGR